MPDISNCCGAMLRYARHDDNVEVAICQECHKEGTNVAIRSAIVVRERNDMRVIVDAMPKTKDSVPVTPPQRVWFSIYERGKETEILWLDVEQICKEVNSEYDAFMFTGISQREDVESMLDYMCFSTPEAAKESE